MLIGTASVSRHDLYLLGNKNMFVLILHIFGALFISLLFTVLFLSHLLVAGCDIGVRFSVRQSVRPSVNIYVDVRLLCQSKYSNQLQD